MLQHFSFDPFWLVALAIAAALYAHAFRRTRAPGRVAHPWARLAAYQAGLLVMAVATLSPLDYWGNRVLWLNFTGFLLVTMVAAPLVVLGAPLTLAFRVAGPDGRTILRRFYRSRLVSAVTFPVVSWLAFAVATYVWQFTALTEIAARHAVVRDLQQASLLLVSLAFWLPALCSDPLRWRMPYPLRVLYVLVEMTHKGLFGGMFLSASHPFHSYFANHAPAWAPSAMTDQRMGILVLWIGGNLIFVAVLIALVFQWIQYEGRNQHRVDLRLKLAREAANRRRAALDQVFHRPL